MSDSHRFRHSQMFEAGAGDIDDLGHVNNAAWVRWLQGMTVAHWSTVAAPDLLAKCLWVVKRHEIDYRANIALGDRAVGETWIEAIAGARMTRRTHFADRDGRVLVEALSVWACIDPTSGKPRRVPDTLLGLTFPQPHAGK